MIKEKMVFNPVTVGTYEGFDFRVCHVWCFPTMQWWTAYVRIPDNHRFVTRVSKRVYYGWGKLSKLAKDKDSKYPFPKVPKFLKRTSHFDYDKVPLEVWGGLTYATHIKTKKQGLDVYQKFTPGWWVGWDYNHAGDDHEIKEEDVPKRYLEGWKYWQNSLREIHLKVYGAKGKPKDGFFAERTHTKEEIIRHCRLAIDQLIQAQKWYYPIIEGYSNFRKNLYWKIFRLKRLLKRKK